MADWKRLKILFVSVSSGLGGAEKLLKDTVLGIDSEKFQPVVVVLKNKAENAKLIEGGGVRVYSLGLMESSRFINLFLIIPSFFKLLGIMRREKPDIVYTYMFIADILGAFSAWLLKIPSIVSIHTVETKRTWQFPFRKMFDFSVTKYCAVSDTVKCYFAEKTGVEKNKICTIKNAVIFNNYRDELKERDFLKEFNVNNDSRVMLAVGRLEKEKAHHVLLRAFDLVCKKYEDVVLFVVGNGEERGCLEALVSELGINENVVFTGYQGDIDRFYSKAFCLLHSSECEGMSMVILEAMASGLPVITTSFYGVEEVIDDGTDGLLVKIGDYESMAEKAGFLLDNCDAYNAMSEAAVKKIADNHRFENYLKAHEKLFWSLVSSQLNTHNM